MEVISRRTGSVHCFAEGRNAKMENPMKKRRVPDLDLLGLRDVWL